MNKLNASFASGLVFGIGLLLSGMTQPDKVIGFLNPVSNWQPTLAFVMVGAIGTHMALYKWILRRPSPLYAMKFGIPTRTDVDARLVGGAMLFGLGWGLGGICPGPGLVSAAAGGQQAMVFIVSMTGGMMLFHAVEKQLVRKTQPVLQSSELPFPVSSSQVRVGGDA